MKIKLIKPAKYIVEYQGQVKELTFDQFSDFHKYKQDLGIEGDCSTRIVWDTPSGEIEIGSAYFAPWMHDNGICFSGWENCKDPRGHLIIKMPDGGYWDTDSRASNCTMKEDKTHRCWVKHGDIENMTVDKQGHTCQAGAGSIQMSTWHGFLRNGELVQ